MDTHDVSGFKSWVEAKAISIIEGKITDEDIRETFDKVNTRYPDKHAKQIILSLKLFFGRVYMVLNNMEKEINAEEIQNTRSPEFQRKKSEDQRRRKGRRMA